MNKPQKVPKVPLVAPEEDVCDAWAGSHWNAHSCYSSSDQHLTLKSWGRGVGLGLTSPKMETQEVCPGGSHHLIYLGILAYTILKIVFSAFLSFLMITGRFKPVPTEGEMHTHTLPQAIFTLQISPVQSKHKYTSKHKPGHATLQPQILHRLC